MTREVPTLGGAVGCWIQDNCAIPDGERRGEPFLLTDDQWQFLLRFYALDEGGKFVHRRGGMIVRPTKQGKSPLAAAIVAAESAGPVRFDHWDDGEPVGKPPATPLVQICAVSVDQTSNTWRALLPMLQLGELAAEIDDIGLTRVNLPGGGRVEFVTAAHRSRVGQRVTFAILDELGLWLPQNHGHKLFDAVARNLAGMGGRFLGTTNAWSTDEESVGQRLAEAGDEDVLVDDVDPPPLSIRNKAERRKMLKYVYGSSAAGCEAQGNAQGWIGGWIDLDRIDGEITSLLDRDEAQAWRFFLNAKRTLEVAAFDPVRWDELADPDHAFELQRNVSWYGEDGPIAYGKSKATITVGADGARFRDSLALIATEVKTGHQWPLGIWTRPENAADDYEHPLEEVDGAMIEAWEEFNVARVYIDPQFIENLVDTWMGRWGEKKVLPWLTSRPRQMAHAVRAYTDAVAAGDMSHNGDKTFRQQIVNATRRPVSSTDDDGRPLYVIAKDRPHSPRKVDAAVAAVLSWEATRDVRQVGDQQRDREVVFLG